MFINAYQEILIANKHIQLNSIPVIFSSYGNHLQNWCDLWRPILIYGLVNTYSWNNMRVKNGWHTSPAIADLWKGMSCLSLHIMGMIQLNRRYAHRDFIERCYIIRDPLFPVATGQSHILSSWRSSSSDLGSCLSLPLLDIKLQMLTTAGYFGVNNAPPRRQWNWFGTTYSFIWFLMGSRRFLIDIVQTTDSD